MGATLIASYRRVFFILACACFGLVVSTANADEKVRINVIGHAEGTSDYYHELIQQSLKQAGYDVELNITYGVPQKRYIAMFEHGLIDVVWLLKSAERNEKYINVDVDLTGGTMGQRVLMIPPGAAPEYSSVKSLDDFRKLGKIGAFGANWFDIDVWQANNLRYQVVDGDWSRIYNMLLLPRWKRLPEPFDYFSRSVSEVLFELTANPELEVEPNLLFIYDRDFNFYISDKSDHLKPILEHSLQLAIESGLRDKLINQYFSDQLAELGLNKRVRLMLKTPE